MPKVRTWTVTQLKNAVRDSGSRRQVLIKLGLREAGGNYDQLKQYIRELKLDVSHFHGQAWNRGRKGFGKPIIPLEKILVSNSSYQSFKLKGRLFSQGLKKPHCEICGWAKKSPDGRLPLELDHINGNHGDNRLENLRILCPNCHSLQPTHRGRNRKLCRGGEIGNRS